MLGALITVLFAFGAAGIGSLVLAKWSSELDPALRLGASGLAGLATLALLTFLIGSLPAGTVWGLYVFGVLGVAGLGLLFRNRLITKPAMPKGAHALGLLAAVLAFGCSLVGVLSPSDSMDWDTLAYHLAVPKIWLQDGSIHYISYIHHSNFPLSVDALFIWGLAWGGQSGAKAFSLMFAIFGAFALFGFARKRYGDAAAWWSVLAYVGIPMVIWESGTAYIDVGNGLYGALGILFAAAMIDNPEERENPWLAGIFLGACAGSKYTGLQTIAVVGLIGLAYVVRSKTSVRGPVVAVVVALAVASPWYVRNVLNTGNPVYPFFYSVFKGKNWDAFSDQIYKDQQQTFGAGRSAESDGHPYTQNPIQPGRIGAAVLGLAYQPGRYADPAPVKDLGFVFVSLGAVPLVVLMMWLIAGRLTRFEGTVAATALVSLCLWFFLSEQSRYILGLMLPLCVIGGGALGRFRSSVILVPIAGVQMLVSLFIITREGDPQPVFSEKLKVALGQDAWDDYQKHYDGFYAPAQFLNETVKGGRVALVDEVFGYFLDVPYFWAGPGHTTEIGWETLTTPNELIASFKRLGITFVYFNLGEAYGRDESAIEQWLGAAGMTPGAPRIPFPVAPADIPDARNRYKVLLALAAADGSLKPIKQFGSDVPTKIVFEVQ
jgi:4-amino-4-deoxy-L-arabinose transferase-like glycosyltransferase